MDYYELKSGDVIEFPDTLEDVRICKVQHNPICEDFYMAVLRNGEPYWLPLCEFRFIMPKDGREFLSYIDCINETLGKTITLE